MRSVWWSIIILEIDFKLIGAYFDTKSRRQTPREIFRRLIFSAQDFWLNRYGPRKESADHSELH